MFLLIGLFFVWIFLKDLSSDAKKEIVNSFINANYWWLLLSLFFGLLSHVLRTLRWQMLMEPIGCKTTFKNTFLALMIGYFANLALPRLGEVTRCGILNKYDKVAFNKSFGTVITERVLDILTFLILFFINLYLQYNMLKDYVFNKFYLPLSEKFTFIGKGYLLYGFIVIALLIAVIIYLLRRKISTLKWFIKIKTLLMGFWDGLRSLLLIKKPLLFIVYTLAIWFSYLMMTYVCFFSIKETVGLGIEPAFSVLVLGTIGIMIVQGGIGIYPVIVAETLALYGVITTTGFALGWIAWGAQTFTIILAGIISLIVLPIINKNTNVKT